MVMLNVECCMFAPEKEVLLQKKSQVGFLAFGCFRRSWRGSDCAQCTTLENVQPLDHRAPPPENDEQIITGPCDGALSGLA